MKVVDLAMDMETLHRVLKTMKVPKDKMNDYQWLLKNLGEENSEHPDLPKAILLVKEIIARMEG